MTGGCGCGCGGGCGGTGAAGAGPCAGASGCGCCAGVQPLTPAPLSNRPGLSQIAYRVGTHGSFLATMEAALSGAAEPALNALGVRTADDPSIAFLDCWATVADVLTFYTERIANEGYLRTATELRSVFELAQLTGYRVRPGLGASAHLAYTLQANPAKVTAVVIPKGSQAMSVPGPGQQPQAFETSDDLTAQQPWNTLPVRATTPATITQAQLSAFPAAVSLQGAALAIHPGNRMVFFAESATPDPGSTRVPMSVQAVSVDASAGVTTLTLLPDPPSASPGTGAPEAPARAPGQAQATAPCDGPLPNLAGLITPLEVRPSVPPLDSAHLARTVTSVFQAGSDVAPQLLTGLAPRLGPGLYQAWAGTTIPADTPLTAAAVQRVKAGVFGATAPPQPITDASGAPAGTREWPLSGSITARIDAVADATSPGVQPPLITVTIDGPAGQPGSMSFAANDPPTSTMQLTSGPQAVNMSVSPQRSGTGGPGPQGEAATIPSFDLVFTLSGGITASIEISGRYPLTDPQVTIGTGGTPYQPVPGHIIRNSVLGGDQVISLTGSAGAPAHLEVVVDDRECPGTARRHRPRRTVRPGGAVRMGRHRAGRHGHGGYRADPRGRRRLQDRLRPVRQGHPADPRPAVAGQLRSPALRGPADHGIRAERPGDTGPDRRPLARPGRFDRARRPVRRAADRALADHHRRANRPAGRHHR